LEEIIPGVFAEKATSSKIEMSSATLISRAEDKNLPNVLSLDQIQQLLGKKWSEILGFEDERMETLEKNRFSFLEGITAKKELRISFDGLDMVVEKADLKRYLEVRKQWPLPEDCLLSNWWDKEPWLTPYPNHPAAEHEWWTPARYFAVQHKEKNPGYGIDELCGPVIADLNEHKIYARGKKDEPPGKAAIKKALGNIPELKKNIKPRRKYS
jgi:hypothetical protein